MPLKTDIIPMFARIAKRYDFANRLLSFGLDQYWRWRMVQFFKKKQPQNIVDFATGSGDVAFTIRRVLGNQPRITGVDFCQPMLKEAKRKQADWPDCKKINFITGDCLDLPFDDHTFDVGTIAFGVRNFENRLSGLASLYRVLRPGGYLVILESSQPYAWLAPVYFFYLKHIMPRIAQKLTHDISAYQYLAESIQAFPSPQALADELRQVGFRDVRFIRPALGIVAIHCAQK